MSHSGDIDEVTSEPEIDTFSRNCPNSNSNDNQGSAIPKVSLGPMRADRQQRTPHAHKVERVGEPNDLTYLRKEIDTQERIIFTLQRDNEVLLRDKKEIAARCKELEEKCEHLEAKHSLLLSAQQDVGSRSNLRLANDAAKIAKLQAHVQELQGALEAEKLKSTAAIHENKIVPPSRSSSTSDTVSAFFHNADKKHNIEQPIHEASAAEGSDHVARLREYERMHAVQKGVIDKLHEEVGRLENEKKKLENQRSNYARQVDELTKRTHELESAVAQKRESIGELLRTCQNATAHAQHLKKQESRIKSLEAALVEKDEFSQRAMERLRSETEEVCKRYQETIANLEKRLELPKDNTALREQLAALKKENADLRCAAEANNATPGQSSDGKPPAAGSDPTGRKEVKTNGSVEQSHNSSLECNAQIMRLETQLTAAAAEAAKHKEQCAGLQSELNNIRLEWDARLQEVKRNFAVQMQMVRATHNDELDRLEAAHRSELLALVKNKQGDDAEDFSARLIRLVEKKGYDWSLVAICERLNYLEKRSLHKEQEMAYELAEVKRMAEMEKRISKEKAYLQIEQKNTQIKSFRLQLDELLASIAVLQATT